MAYPKARKTNEKSYENKIQIYGSPRDSKQIPKRKLAKSDTTWNLKWLEDVEGQVTNDTEIT